MEYTLKEFKNAEGQAFEALTFKDNDMADFLIEWKKIEDHYADFVIHEITSWETDIANTPSDYEKYVRGTIKWDGCSHIYFGDGEPADAYLHLCGKHSFDMHCNVMQAIWDICSKRIKSFDHDVAS